MCIRDRDVGDAASEQFDDTHLAQVEVRRMQALEQHQHAVHALGAMHHRTGKNLVRDPGERPGVVRDVGSHRLPVQLGPAEHLAMRDRVGMVDLTAFNEFDIKGPGAMSGLQAIVVNNVDVPVGRSVYTPLLTPHGVFRRHLTIFRRGEEHFRVITGAFDGGRDNYLFNKYLPADGTVTFTEGDAADIETTALATIAFLNANRYPETTTKALTYIIQKKSAQGHWGSTQATILALKALMLSLGSRTETVNAKVTVALNGEQVSELAVTPEDCDVMRLVDLGEKTKAGSNTVTLTIDGEGSMLYQVVGRFYTPWVAAQPEQAPMSIEVAYDKTRLAVNDMVKARVKVTNNRPNAAQMIHVDLGIPPGFEVQAADLEKLVENKTIQKYEMTGRQIIVYFERIDGNGVIEFQYALRAKFPLRAQTPSSRAVSYTHLTLPTIYSV